MEPSRQVEKLILPIDEYVTSRAEDAVASNATEILMRECMGKKGYDWAVIDWPTDVQALLNRRRYGLIEADVAERLGYHTPDDFVVPETEAGNRDLERENSLPAVELRAAYGQGTGCANQAGEQLWGGPPPELDILNDMDSASLRKSRADDGVARALRGWKQCMKREGFHYSSPSAASGDPAWPDGDQPSDREVEVAVTDVGCKHKTRLAEVWFAAEKKTQLRMIEGNRKYFDRLKAAKDRYLGNARRVIASDR
ncbi:hypothetical protein [Streptomyces sp. B8F3]|uniref:hypothetical protein n=1 Tax=unclassified Streptomyces TaxID=2593676 RepID=UPI00325D873D